MFRAVARRYDVMNDTMSLGSHCIFKRMVLHMSGVRSGGQVLDLAGGGDRLLYLLALSEPVGGWSADLMKT